MYYELKTVKQAENGDATKNIVNHKIIFAHPYFLNDPNLIRDPIKYSYAEMTYSSPAYEDLFWLTYEDWVIYRRSTLFVILLFINRHLRNNTRCVNCNTPCRMQSFVYKL